MALIILLILSEDDLFNKNIHKILIKKLAWYTERSLSEISIGGLLILVIIRTIQFNMTRMRDKYLHTNCLAALANMSAKFENLHPYVCQRINSLFQLLAKRRTKIINMINKENKKNEQLDSTPATEQNANVSIDLETTTTITNMDQDLMQDLSIIEELMRMVLEIINSTITNSIHHNADLVYSILYNKSLYAQFFTHPTFQDVIQNIEMVIFISYISSIHH
jgi:dymeclin